MTADRGSDRRSVDAWRSHPPPIRAPAGVASSTDRLARLLHILPAAARPSGVGVRELAEEFGVPESTILADLRQVADRAFYLPPGPGTQIQISTENGEVHVHTTGEFRRPVRLTPPEAAALSFGLRVAALSPSGPSDRADRDRLRDHLERGLSVANPEDVERPFEPLAPDLSGEGDEIRRTLARAARDHAPCEITYVKPGSGAPEKRTIHPYLVLSRQEFWYVVAHCRAAGDLRHFRLDRVVAARRLEGSFEVPLDFDPESSLDVLGVVRDERSPEATIRYTDRTARRMSEMVEGVQGTAGSFVVRRPVLDPDWLVRHVFSNAGEVEVVSPPSLRGLVHDRAARLGTPVPRG